MKSKTITFISILPLLLLGSIANAERQTVSATIRFVNPASMDSLFRAKSEALDRSTFNKTSVIGQAGSPSSESSDSGGHKKSGKKDTLTSAYKNLKVQIRSNEMIIE